MANSRNGIPRHTDIPRNGWDLLGMHNFRMLLGHFLGQSPQKLLFLWQCWVFCCWGAGGGGGEGRPTIQRFPYVWQGWSQHRKGLPYSGHHQCYISIPILKQSATTLKIVIRCTSTPLPPKKRMPLFISGQKKKRNKKVNNFKSHLSVGFFTRNYTCLA